MRSLVPVVVVVATLTACGQAPQRRGSAEVAQMRTVDSTPPQPAKLEGPPMLTDEAPPPKPKVMTPWETPTVVQLTPEDEKVRSALPFSPAIAMDPIDGSKISIRANTPTMDYKGKIYYFSNEANLAQAKANPEVALKGNLMKL